MFGLFGLFLVFWDVAFDLRSLLFLKLYNHSFCLSFVAYVDRHALFTLALAVSLKCVYS